VELIGARWNGQILDVLFGGRQRFCDIRAAVPGISDTMLAHRLRELEERGLVERRVTAGPPIRVDYRPTRMGSDLQPVLDAIAAWAQEWSPISVAASPGPPDLSSDPAAVQSPFDSPEVNHHA
jgi:DNA-binding HxlR family transcriptional regulator